MMGLVTALLAVKYDGTDVTILLVIYDESNGHLACCEVCWTEVTILLAVKYDGTEVIRLAYCEV